MAAQVGITAVRDRATVETCGSPGGAHFPVIKKSQAIAGRCNAGPVAIPMRTAMADGCLDHERSKDGFPSLIDKIPTSFSSPSIAARE